MASAERRFCSARAKRRAANKPLGVARTFFSLTRARRRTTGAASPSACLASDGKVLERMKEAGAPRRPRALRRALSRANARAMARADCASPAAPRASASRAPATRTPPMTGPGPMSPVVRGVPHAPPLHTPPTRAPPKATTSPWTTCWRGAYAAAPILTDRAPAVVPRAERRRRRRRWRGDGDGDGAAGGGALPPLPFAVAQLILELACPTDVVLARFAFSCRVPICTALAVQARPTARSPPPPPRSAPSPPPLRALRSLALVP